MVSHFLRLKCCSVTPTSGEQSSQGVEMHPEIMHVAGGDGLGGILVKCWPGVGSSLE